MQALFEDVSGIPGSAGAMILDTGDLPDESRVVQSIGTISSVQASLINSLRHECISRRHVEPVKQANRTGQQHRQQGLSRLY